MTKLLAQEPTAAVSQEPRPATPAQSFRIAWAWVWRIIAYTMLLVVVFFVGYFAYLVVFPNAPRAEPGSPWVGVIGACLSAVATFPAWRAMLRKKFHGFEIRLLLSPIRQAPAALPVSWGNVLRTYGSFWVRVFIPAAVIRSLNTISPWEEILLLLVTWAVLHWMLSDPLRHENAPGKIVLTLHDTSELGGGAGDS